MRPYFRYVSGKWLFLPFCFSPFLINLFLRAAPLTGPKGAACPGSMGAEAAAPGSLFRPMDSGIEPDMRNYAERAYLADTAGTAARGGGSIYERLCSGAQGGAP
jgi:hypothetical protein